MAIKYYSIRYQRTSTSLPGVLVESIIIYGSYKNVTIFVSKVPASTEISTEIWKSTYFLTIERLVWAQGKPIFNKISLLYSLDHFVYNVWLGIL